MAMTEAELVSLWSERDARYAQLRWGHILTADQTAMIVAYRMREAREFPRLLAEAARWHQPVSIHKR